MSGSGRTTAGAASGERRRRVGALAASALLCLAPAAFAQDLSLLAGSISSLNSWPKSYAWSFSYRHNWLENLSTTVSYLNHGHFPGHHRDGVAAEVWGQLVLLDDRLTLAAGGGPFYYYDTTVAARGGSYSDNHAFAYLYSVGATWRMRNRWFYELRVDRTSPSSSIETTSISLGAGYRLEPDVAGWDGGGPGGSGRDELTVYYGKTVVNSFSSQEARAKAVEVKRAFGPTLRASLAYVNEGDARLIRRSGGIAEAWLEPAFFNNRFSVGVGVGAYAAIDKYRPTSGRHVSGIVTMTMSYRFLDRVNARFNWHRIVTDYDRDTDIVVLGVGYRF
jgi:hypothetical protein